MGAQKYNSTFYDLVFFWGNAHSFYDKCSQFSFQLSLGDQAHHAVYTKLETTGVNFSIVNSNSLQQS